MAKAKYYTVWQGRTPGVYDSWQACEEQVKGVAAKYKGFATKEEAEVALQHGWEDYYSVAPKADQRETINAQSADQCEAINRAQTAPILPALAVDAACSGNPGMMEFRGVIADTGTEVFHRGPYACGTNNIGEFLAIILGLAYLKKHNLPWVLYSDSKTAQAWVRRKQANTNLEWNSQNQELLQMIRAGEKWLHENTWTTPILKWDTEHWGEIPADFGRK